MTVSAPMIAVTLSAPFCGAIAERFGRKRVIVLASFLFAIPTLLAATASTISMLIFWRFVQGVVAPGIFAVTIAYITEEWPNATVAKAMSFYISGGVLGGFLGRLITGCAATHRVLPGIAPDWYVGFIILGLCSLILAILVARWLPKDRAVVQPSVAVSSKSVFRHLRNPQLVATYIVGFNVLFSLMAIFTYVTFPLAAPPYLLTPVQLSWLFTVFLVGLVVTPLSGPWIAKVGCRQVLMTSVIAGMLGVSLTLAPSLPLILVGLALCSSGVFVSQCAANSYLQTAAPAGERSSATGLYVAFYYIGGSLSGVLPGYLWRFGGWTICVILVLFVHVLTIATAGFAWKSQRSEKEFAAPAGNVAG
jgi:MFS family permease